MGVRAWKILFRILNDFNEEDYKGSVVEFSTIFGQYFDQIYRFLYFRLRNEQDAEDLAAETFEKVYKNFDKFEERGFGLKAWIYQIAKNVLNDFYRKKKLNVDSIDDLLPGKQPSEDFLLEDLDRVLLMENLWEVIQKLPSKQQTLWGLKLVDDMSHSDIASVMETTEANVNVMIHRSVKLLRKYLVHLKNEE